MITTHLYKSDPGLERFVQSYTRVASVPGANELDRLHGPISLEQTSRAEEIYRVAMNGGFLTEAQLRSFCSLYQSFDAQGVLAHNQLSNDQMRRLRKGDRVFWYAGGDCPGMPRMNESKVSYVGIREGNLVDPLIGNYWMDSLIRPGLWIAAEDSRLVAALKTRSTTMTREEFLRQWN